MAIQTQLDRFFGSATRVKKQPPPPPTISYWDGTEITLPAGKYWLGDPCNTNLHEDLLDMVNAVITFSDEKKAAYSHNGYGDGGFEDTEGRYLYGIDTGTLGVFPFEFVATPKWRELGSVHEFQKEFKFCVKDNVFIIGNDEEMIHVDFN